MAAVEPIEPGGICAHEPCTCDIVATEREGSLYCHDLCSDAANAAESEVAYSLCPCLHKECEANGDKTLSDAPAAEIQPRAVS